MAAQLNGKPALFLVESSTPGLTVKADPSMGLRAAALGQIELDKVTVPLSARLGEDAATDSDYSQALALSRLGWAALAVGTCHAVLDHVMPYIKGARGVRRADRPPSVGGIHVRQHRHRARRPAPGDLARRVAVRPGTAVHPGSRSGQAAGDRQGHADRPGRVQLLGGHGYTKEHPVERWYRDLRALGVAEGVLVI